MICSSHIDCIDVLKLPIFNAHPVSPIQVCRKDKMIDRNFEAIEKMKINTEEQFKIIIGSGGKTTLSEISKILGITNKKSLSLILEQHPNLKRSKQSGHKQQQPRMTIFGIHVKTAEELSSEATILLICSTNLEMECI